MELAGKRLWSGELAKLTGVSTDTLRHYERLGLLPLPRRTEAGYRLYPSDAVKRVQIVPGGLSLGFSLSELGRILQTRDGGGIPCKQVRRLAASKLQQIDQHLKDLLFMRKQIEELIGVWDERLGRTQEGERAGLLDMLVQDSPAKDVSGKG